MYESFGTTLFIKRELSASASEVGDLQTNGMAVNQLTGLFQFDLILGTVAHLKCSIECDLGFSLDDIFTAISFVDKHLQIFGRDFDDATADRKVIQLVI